MNQTLLYLKSIVDMRQGKSVNSRDYVVLYPDNYPAWANDFLKRSYVYGQAGKYLRFFDFSRDSMVLDRKTKIKAYLSPEQSPEPQEQREICYENVEGGADLLVDLLTSISKDSEKNITAHSGYKTREREGRFLHIWEIIHETHSQVSSSLNLL